METPITDTAIQHEVAAPPGDDRLRRKKSRAASGRLLDLKAAEAYPGAANSLLNSMTSGSEHVPALCTRS
jgi:hypothetical protein